MVMCLQRVNPLLRQSTVFQNTQSAYMSGGPAMGHDKLYKIGLPIWAKWLGAWVVTSNHIGKIIVYLFLCLVEKFGGV